MNVLSPEELERISGEIDSQQQRDRSLFRFVVIAICLFELAVIGWVAAQWWPS